MDKTITAGIKLDIKKIINAHAYPPHGFNDVYEECRNMISVLETVLGPAPGSQHHTQIRVSLQEAVKEIHPKHRQDAASILLGLCGEGATFSARIDEVVRLYNETNPKPPRRNRQVILRSEVPELEKVILGALLHFIDRFISTKTLQPRHPSRQAHQALNAIQWDHYDDLMQRLTDSVENWLLRLQLDSPKPRETVVLGIAKGGLIPSVQLAHSLGNVQHGTLGLWRFRDNQGKGRVVVDALYGPPRRFKNSPRAIIVVDDILGRPGAVSCIGDELCSHYGDVDICFVALCQRSDEVYDGKWSIRSAMSYDPASDWIQLPWERNRPART